LLVSIDAVLLQNLSQVFLSVEAQKQKRPSRGLP